MGLNDRAANRQTHSHAVRFRREECVEDPCNILRRYAGPAVFNRRLYVARFQGSGLDPQESWSIGQVAHGIGSIGKEVQYDLLAENKLRETRRELALVGRRTTV